MHHLLSLIERRYFFLADWEDITVDIWEQYPLLPLEETLSIAEEQGIKHPIDPRTKKPNVLTTDFVLTLKGAFGIYLLARAIKPSEELSDKRTLEKLKIEELYWKARQIPWCIVTEKEISAVKAANIEWLHPRRSPDSIPISPAMIPMIQDALEKRVSKFPDYPLTHFTQEVDAVLKLPIGISLVVVRHLLAAKIWQTDMSVRINPDRPIALLPAHSAL